MSLARLLLAATGTTSSLTAKWISRQFLLTRLAVGFTKDTGNPILAKGTAGQWDDWLVRELGPARDEYGLTVTESDGVWAYYWGQEQAEPGATFQIGLAKSLDNGASYTRYGSNPVIVPGGATWYNTDILQPSVVKESTGRRVMFATGWNGASTTSSMGVLTSTDGLSWTDQGQKLTLGQFSEGGTAMVEMGVPSMLKRSDGSWLVLFEALKSGVTNGWRIFAATATDPTGTWTPMNGGEPIFTPGSGFESVGVANPHIIENMPGEFAMIYNGISGTPTWKVAFAYSDDLATWTRYGSNPIVVPDAGSGWDNLHTEACYLFKEPASSTMRIYYNGFSNVDGSAQIGLATA